MPGRATRRMLQRSIIQPITGTIRALTTPPTENANEAVPRCQPISAMIGFKNTPKVKASTGPLQTNKPVTAPPTTHQGLLNLLPKMSSRDAAGLGPGLESILSRRAQPGQWRGMHVVRPSRRARWALLRMTYFFSPIINLRHPEEAAKRLSRRTRDHHPT